MTADDIRRYQQYAKVLRERLLSLLAENPNASDVIRAGLVDMISALRACERHAGYVIEELQRQGGRV